ncbi:MAG: GNAT family N-acetyltransferase [Rhodothermaceae bacterium]
MYKYKSLTDVSYQEIHDAFAKAFADYYAPFDLTLEEMAFMIERRGYNPDISFGAFYEGELVGFTLNCMGEWKNILTAYDTGTGIIKEHRKKGLAKQIFIESMPVLKKHNINQYLLETIDENVPAIELYKKMGFATSREFDFSIVKIEDVNFSKPDDSFELEITKNIDWQKFKTFWNENPSWQNSVEAVTRKQNYFVCCVAKHKDEIVGYGLIQKSNGDVPQLAVKKEFRKKGIGSAILKELSVHTEADEFRIINSVRKDEETNGFFKKIGIVKKGGQLEMTMDL